MKQFFKRFLPPTLIDRLAKMRYSEQRSPYRDMKHDDVFQQIYEQQDWGKGQTVSGAGSTLEQTNKIASGIELFIQQENITSLLDLPCGDFNWMQVVNLNGTSYIGGDIVPELISENNKLYANNSVSFQQLDLLKDNLPPSDLILNRDCFVHFSYEDIFQALKNIEKSGAKYFMSTSFPELTLNYNIVTGDWRPLNLELAPFNFPKPKFSIQEFWEPGFEKEYKGKMLGIWLIEDLNSSM